MAFSMSLGNTSTMKLSVPFVPKLSTESSRCFSKPIQCLPAQQQINSGIMCEPCGGTGWLLCDFCKGQKTNVKSETSKIYRRCPTCRATGYILCSKCKVFKCVTFPNEDDGTALNF